jgi:MFS family permease
MLVDRFESRRLLAVVSLVQAGIAVALAFTRATAPILVLATLLGIGYALAQPAEFSLVPTVAPMPPTTGSATAPSCSRWPAAGCS